MSEREIVEVQQNAMKDEKVAQKIASFSEVSFLFHFFFFIITSS